MRILIHLAPDIAAIRATLPLAKQLLERGHQPVYTVIPDTQTAVSSEGFDVITLHSDIMPAGTLSRLSKLGSTEELEQAEEEISVRIADAYLSGDMLELVQSCEPDIALCDIKLYSPLQMALYRLGVPCLQISTSWASLMDDLPPSSAHMTTRATYVDLLGAKWQESCLNKHFLGVRSTFMLSAAIDRYATALGYPSDNISFDATDFPALTAFQTATCCPKALDFNTNAKSNRLYLALPYTPDQPSEIPHDLEVFVTQSKPVIYVTLGEAAHRYPDAQNFWQALFKVARTNSQYRIVIDASPLCQTMFWSNDLPSNAFLCHDAPSDWLLQHSDVVITQTDIHILRAAIEHTVPTIAIPQENEQRGSAARIVDHGLGIRLLPRLLTPLTLEQALTRILDNPQPFHTNLSTMKTRCNTETFASQADQIILGLAPEEKAAIKLPPAIKPSISPQSENDKQWAFFEDDSYLKGTLYPSLTSALANAKGSFLAEFDSTGQACLWVKNISEMLYRHADWCASQILDIDEAQSPDCVDFFRAMLANHRAQEKHANGGKDTKMKPYREAFAAAVTHWHRGYGAVAKAFHHQPHKAAYGAQLEAIATLARYSVDSNTDTTTGSDIFLKRYRELKLYFAEKLQNEITKEIHNTI